MACIRRDQAWNHYRHLESTRGQYLGFFFSILVASVGLALGLIRDVKPDAQAMIIFGLLVLAFVDFLVTIGLFTAIKKTGYVLKRYEIIMNTVRRISGFRSSRELPFDLADMKGYPGIVLNSGVFSVQRSAELVLVVASCIFVALLVILATFLFTSGIPFTPWHQVLGVGVAAVATCYLSAVFGPLVIAAIRRPKQDHSDPGS